VYQGYLSLPVRMSIGIRNSSMSRPSGMSNSTYKFLFLIYLNSFKYKQIFCTFILLCRICFAVTCIFADTSRTRQCGRASAEFSITLLLVNLSAGRYMALRGILYLSFTRTSGTIYRIVYLKIELYLVFNVQTIYYTML